ncbi:M20 family metallopeptidase [Pararhodobacter sp.]|uniref:M20 family metallopeptidase n=1 Tax=Pararhodobacter sp. TaxID=2127056 RepID=UPI002FDD7F1D
MSAGSMASLDASAIGDEIGRWVSVESPSADAEAVNRMVDLAEDRLRAMGASIERQVGQQGCGDILTGRIAGQSEGPGILMLGHLDTVHPLGTLQGALPLRRDGDRLYGPGAYDMKGGNVLGFAALAHLHAQGRRPRLPVTVMMIPDEELGSPTSRPAIEAEAARAACALVLEPSGGGGALTVARHGMVRYHLRVEGVSAHAGAEHEKGVSAIREMAHQVLAIEALSDNARDFTVNVGLIRGGIYENRVPDLCEATVYARVPGPAEADELRAALDALKPHHPKARITLTPGLYRPPYEKTPQIQALYELACACADELGIALNGARVAGGGSDGNFTAAAGLPTLDGLGVIGGGPHTHEEYALISSLAPRARLLVALLERIGAS